MAKKGLRDILEKSKRESYFLTVLFEIEPGHLVTPYFRLWVGRPKKVEVLGILWTASFAAEENLL